MLFVDLKYAMNHDFYVDDFYIKKPVLSCDCIALGVLRETFILAVALQETISYKKWLNLSNNNWLKNLQQIQSFTNWFLKTEKMTMNFNFAYLQASISWLFILELKSFFFCA